MPLALLGSVKQVEGAHGVNSYLTAKLAYMPSDKPRKPPIKTDDAIANTRRALDHYLTQEQPFSIKELCERANITSSWLYRKDNPTVAALLKQVKETLEIVGKSKQRRHLEAIPPEPVLDIQAIARDWLDRQIEQHQEYFESLRQRQETIEVEQELNRQQMQRIQNELEHLHKVRELTKTPAESSSSLGE